MNGDGDVFFDERSSTYLPQIAGCPDTTMNVTVLNWKPNKIGSILGMLALSTHCLTTQQRTCIHSDCSQSAMA